MDTITEIDSRSIWWSDDLGTVHCCEGADVHHDVRLFWTLCGRDVPAGQAYHPREGRLTCEDCLKAE